VAENREEFIALILKNESGMLASDVTFYFEYPIGCQKKIEIAVVALSLTNEMEVVQSTFNQPYNATFYEMDGITNSINIGDIQVDGMIGIWFKKILNKDVILDEYSDDNLILNGTPQPSDELISMNMTWGEFPLSDLIPKLTTATITSITQTSAISGGEITDEGYTPVLVSGICWSNNPTPTILDEKTIDGTLTGSFVSNLTELDGYTAYYVKSYATNTNGTGYGNEISFTTSPILPEVFTSSLIDLSSTEISVDCEVVSDGGDPVTVRGVCWSTSVSPTIALITKTDDGTGEGVFTSNVTGLIHSTKYYIRAYATNGLGTSYGEERMFVTLF